MNRALDQTDPSVVKLDQYSSGRLRRPSCANIYLKASLQRVNHSIQECSFHVTRASQEGVWRYCRKWNSIFDRPSTLGMDSRTTGKIRDILQPWDLFFGQYWKPDPQRFQSNNFGQLTFHFEGHPPCNSKGERTADVRSWLVSCCVTSGTKPCGKKWTTLRWLTVNKDRVVSIASKVPRWVNLPCSPAESQFGKNT